MTKQNNSAKEQLLKLEKLVKRIIRKSLKNNTLDYTVQITTSSIEPGKLKYAAHISSPAAGVQPITFVYDNFETLVATLEKAEQDFNPKEVEIAFHKSRINTYHSKAAQHEKRVEVLESPDYDPELDAIPMEEVKTDE